MKFSVYLCMLINIAYVYSQDECTQAGLSCAENTPCHKYYNQFDCYCDTFGNFDRSVYGVCVDWEYCFVYKDSFRDFNQIRSSVESSCPYTYSQSSGLATDDRDYFDITLQSGSGNEWREFIEVDFKGRGLTIGIYPNLTINGEPTDSYDENDIYVRYIYNRGAIILETDFGFFLAMASSYITIRIAETYTNKVDGLCGVYNDEEPRNRTQDMLESFVVGECEKPECEIGDDSCGENAHCSDIDGTNACICDDGYTGDGKICEDECSASGQPCEEFTSCKKMFGQYGCYCPDSGKKPVYGICEKDWARCSLYQDNNVRAFNGNTNRLNTSSECPYTYSQSSQLPTDNQHYFDVTIQTGSGNEWRECIEVEFKGRDLTIGIFPNLTICCYVTSYTYSKINGEPTDSYNKDGIYVRYFYNGAGVILETEFGFVLSTNSIQTAIFIASDYMTEVDGLCGEYTYSNEDPAKLTQEILESFALGECKNDCEIGDDSCGENTHCSDVDGPNACVCDDGYTGDGTICEDIDECTSVVNDCDVDAACINTEGSYVCVCNDGYTGDGMTCTELQVPTTPQPIPTLSTRVECTNGRVYCTCHLCEVKCEDREYPPPCPPETCENGCGCPHGTFVLDDACVPAEECPEIVPCK